MFCQPWLYIITGCPNHGCNQYEWDHRLKQFWNPGLSVASALRKPKLGQFLSICFQACEQTHSHLVYIPWAGRSLPSFLSGMLTKVKATKPWLMLTTDTYSACIWQHGFYFSYSKQVVKSLRTAHSSKGVLPSHFKQCNGICLHAILFGTENCEDLPPFFRMTFPQLFQFCGIRQFFKLLRRQKNVQ